MVDPFTVMMSSLPSLSQSISPAPPLMDSTMYFFSGVEIWETDRPASWATSLKPGTGDCADGDFEAGVWADAHSGSNRPRERMARMTRNFLIIDQDHSGDSRPWAVRASKARRLSRSFLKLATGIWYREDPAELRSAGQPGAAVPMCVTFGAAHTSHPTACDTFWQPLL